MLPAIRQVAMIAADDPKSLLVYHGGGSAFLLRDPVTMAVDTKTSACPSLGANGFTKKKSPIKI
jgi:hypothetical protein